MIMRITLWGSLLPCMLLYFLAPWLVPAIYGDAYAKSSDVIQAIMLGVWMALIFKVLNSDLAGRGKPQAALWVYALALLINIALKSVDSSFWLCWGGLGFQRELHLRRTAVCYYLRQDEWSGTFELADSAKV